VTAFERSLDFCSFFGHSLQISNEETEADAPG
jgi:hypothetical protein